MTLEWWVKDGEMGLLEVGGGRYIEMDKRVKW